MPCKNWGKCLKIRWDVKGSVTPVARMFMRMHDLDGAITYAFAVVQINRNPASLHNFIRSSCGFASLLNVDPRVGIIRAHILPSSR